MKLTLSQISFNFTHTLFPLMNEGVLAAFPGDVDEDERHWFARLIFF
jgi:hypothetical protein